MKLVITVVKENTKFKLSDELVSSGYALTELSSVGGFLGEANVTLFTCVEDEQVDAVIGTIERVCSVSDRFLNVASEPMQIASPFLSIFGTQPVQSQEGGAVAFVIPVDSIHKF